MKKRNYSISVAMATYNGEKYIVEQIKSILKNLSQEDELIISDDGSTDKTLFLINSFQDERIKIFKGPKKGVKQNFANALKHTNGEIIFLADQDDIWLFNKVTKVLEVFENTNCSCLVHDCSVVNEDLSEVLYDSFFLYRKSKYGIIRNIYKNRYLGCCMAFRSKMKEKILPIPQNIEMHDQWIGLLCEKDGGVEFLKEILLKYRRHENNTSQMKHYPLPKMIKNRYCLIKEYIKRIKRQI